LVLLGGLKRERGAGKEREVDERERKREAGTGRSLSGRGWETKETTFFFFSHDRQGGKGRKKKAGRLAFDLAGFVPAL